MTEVRGAEAGIFSKAQVPAMQGTLQPSMRAPLKMLCLDWFNGAI